MNIPEHKNKLRSYAGNLKTTERKQKLCISCETVKPRERFYTTPYSRDGLRSWCKECWIKGRQIARHKKKGLFIEEKMMESSGTSKNLSLPKENYKYFISIKE